MILVTAIPFGIYDLVEAMDNVESAAAAGDSFPTTQVLDRRRNHQPDWLLPRQSVHQRGLHRPSRLERRWADASDIPAATGVMVLVLTWLGIAALISSLIPVVAILPILLYIGMLIGSQAFQESPPASRAGDHIGDDAADRRLG